jgi:predicted RNA binding protein YcfA (HicA-like mRNA interferase family)
VKNQSPTVPRLVRRGSPNEPYSLPRDGSTAAFMTKPSKLYEQLLANPNAIISFTDFDALFVAFGFKVRHGKGSHRNYKHPKVPAVLTAQPRGKDAVPYQVKRLLAVIKEYDLHIAE